MSPPPGRIIREGWAIARSTPLGSLVLTVVSALVCAAVFLTAGRAAAAEDAVLGRIDDAGTRLVRVESRAPSADLDLAAVERVNAVERVEWALGVGVAFDVWNAAVEDGGRAPARTLVGTVPPELTLVSGRWPAPGEAVVSTGSAAAVGLVAAAGAVTGPDGVHRPVVGVFRADGALAELGGYVLVGAGAVPSDEVVGSMYVVADTAAAVPAVASAVRMLAAVDEPSQLTVTTSQSLVEISAAVSGDLGAYSRQLAVGVLGTGLVVVAATITAATAARRRDFGRRRALGAARSTLVVLVQVQALVPAALGATAGTAAGAVAVRTLTGHLPTIDVLVAVPVLTLLVASAGALPGAVAAALRDPVRILRVP